jgi:putative endonuclease
VRERLPSATSQAVASVAAIAPHRANDARAPGAQRPVRGQASAAASLAPSRAPRAALGRLGEQLAADHLHGLGFAILARGVRTSGGEIDVIASRGAVLIFVEVKARRVSVREGRARDDQDPLAGIGPHKRARLRRAAAAWLAQRDRARPRTRHIRFDAIGVIVDGTGRVRSLEHIEDAF